jgi:hypothetical protein
VPERQSIRLRGHKELENIVPRRLITDQLAGSAALKSSVITPKWLEFKRI